MPSATRIRLTYSNSGATLVTLLAAPARTMSARLARAGRELAKNSGGTCDLLNEPEPEPEPDSLQTRIGLGLGLGLVDGVFGPRLAIPKTEVIAMAMLDEAADGVLGASAMMFNLATPFLRGLRCHWGLRAEEAARSFPGDELVPEPRWQWTHAVAIDAAPARVWPWVAQLGQDKAGFYSYEALENLVGCEIHNADRIRPEWSSPAPGDTLRLHPKAPPLTVHEVRPPERMLVSAGLDPATGRAPTNSQQPYVAVSWLFQLEPLPGERTRLISRYRCASSTDLATRLAYGPYLMEAVGFVMDRRMLLGIQERAERPAI